MHAALPYLCPSNYPTLATPLLATLTLQSVLHWPGRKITLQGFEVKGHFGIPFQYSIPVSIPVFHSSIALH